MGTISPSFATQLDTNKRIQWQLKISASLEQSDVLIQRQQPFKLGRLCMYDSGL